MGQVIRLADYRKTTVDLLGALYDWWFAIGQTHPNEQEKLAPLFTPLLNNEDIYPALLEAIGKWPDTEALTRALRTLL